MKLESVKKGEYHTLPIGEGYARIQAQEDGVKVSFGQHQTLFVPNDKIRALGFMPIRSLDNIKRRFRVITKSCLQKIAVVLDIPAQGTKQTIIDSVLNYLLVDDSTDTHQ